MSGSTDLVDVPSPMVSKGQILIRTNCSLISSGTERMLVEFSRSNLITKALKQPDKVRAAFEKIKTDGLFSTLESIEAKLDKPLALGYCNVGIIKAIGENVNGFMV